MESLSDLQTTRTAHTLFLDFVSYSRLSGAGQAAVQRELQALVSTTRPVQDARLTDALLVRRTGDGMALLFFDRVDQPLRCAMELDTLIRLHATRLREAVGAPFRIRIGIHSGPVVVMDEGGDVDVAGEGINLAQRVMDCGDDGHILLSGTVAEMVGKQPEWARWLHDLGTCRVKHDELVRLWSLHGSRDDGMPLGNEAVPRQVFVSQDQARRLAERDLELMKEEQKDAVKGAALRGSAIALVGLLVIGGGFFLYARTRTAAGEYTRFSKKIGAAVEKRRAEKSRRDAPVPAFPSGTPAPPLSTIDASVPDLTGLSRGDAAERLSALGLKLLVDERRPREPHPSIAAGLIVAQDPKPGRALVGNGEVFVTLSSGGPDGSAPTPSPVPNAYTGVLIDARGIAAPGPGDLFLIAGDGATASSRLTRSDDEAEALQKAGGNPLRVVASGWGDSGGLRLADTDIDALKALPAAAQSRLVVLYRP